MEDSSADSKGMPECFSESRGGDLPSSVELLFDALFDPQQWEQGAFLRALRTFRIDREHACRKTRKLAIVLGHLRFLMEIGETLFLNCHSRQGSRLNRVLEVHRVCLEGGAIHRLVARITLGELEEDEHSFHAFNEGPSVVIYYNPVIVEDSGGQLASGDFDTRLSIDDLIEIFRNKQIIADRVLAARIRSPKRGDMFVADAIKRDVSAIRDMLDKRDAGVRSGDLSGRDTHPYRGAQLCILPRLVGAGDRVSILKRIKDNLQEFKARGFSSIILGPVDRQSASLYFGEKNDGKLVAHINNHGYWSSGEVGIDPALGTDEDFCELVRVADALGIGFTQDNTFGTLGYTPQLARFACSGISVPSQKLVIGGMEIDVWEEPAFLHEQGISEHEDLNAALSSEDYACVLGRVHVGRPFELPRPNTFLPEVLMKVMDRAYWQIAHGGVNSFRIDMAKHLGIESLQAIIGGLRGRVDDVSKRHGYGTPKAFSAILEYWSMNYRDIRFGALALGMQADGVYLYDFPLAQAIQDILIRGRGFLEIISCLLESRQRNSIDLFQMIPFLIDHDFKFMPIYNGDRKTCSLVVIGYALCLALSANAPVVYFQYGNAAAGPPDMTDYFSRSEQCARKVVGDFFCSEDKTSPATPLTQLLRAFERHAVLKNWDGCDIDVRGCDDRLEIRRAFKDVSTGARRVLCARFFRKGLVSATDANLDSGHGADWANRGDGVLFSHLDGPSVIFAVEAVSTDEA